MRCTDPHLRRLPIAAYLRCLICASTLLACAADSSPASPPELDAGGLAPAQRADGEASTSEFKDAALEIDAGSDADADAGAEADASSDATDALAGPDAGAARADDRRTLVVAGLWQSVGPFDDPFDHRPDFPRCPAAASMAEILGDEPVFSVNTADCDYVTVSQPIQRDVAAGETLKVRLWHFELDAPEPAEAHAALLVDGLPVLDEWVPIPQPGGLIAKELRVARDIGAGALAHFHLHNHGANSWSLVEVSAGP